MSRYVTAVMGPSLKPCWQNGGVVWRLQVAHMHQMFVFSSLPVCPSVVFVFRGYLLLNHDALPLPLTRY